MIICEICGRAFPDKESIKVLEPELVRCVLVPGGLSVMVRATLPCCGNRIEVETNPEP